MNIIVGLNGSVRPAQLAPYLNRVRRVLPQATVFRVGLSHCLQGQVATIADSLALSPATDSPNQRRPNLLLDLGLDPNPDLRDLINLFHPEWMAGLTISALADLQTVREIAKQCPLAQVIIRLPVFSSETVWHHAFGTTTGTAYVKLAKIIRSWPGFPVCVNREQQRLLMSQSDLWGLPKILHLTTESPAAMREELGKLQGVYQLVVPAESFFPGQTVESYDDAEILAGVRLYARNIWQAYSGLTIGGRVELRLPC